jgi:hypothetical protein
MADPHEFSGAETGGKADTRQEPYRSGRQGCPGCTAASPLPVSISIIINQETRKHNRVSLFVPWSLFVSQSLSLSLCIYVQCVFSFFLSLFIFSFSFFFPPSLTDGGEVAFLAGGDEEAGFQQIETRLLVRALVHWVSKR